MHQQALNNPLISNSSGVEIAHVASARNGRNSIRIENLTTAFNVDRLAFRVRLADGGGVYG